MLSYGKCRKVVRFVVQQIGRLAQGRLKCCMSSRLVCSAQTRVYWLALNDWRCHSDGVVAYSVIDLGREVGPEPAQQSWVHASQHQAIL